MFLPLYPTVNRRLALAVALCLAGPAGSAFAAGLPPLPAGSQAPMSPVAPSAAASPVAASPTILDRPITILPVAPVGPAQPLVEQPAPAKHAARKRRHKAETPPEAKAVPAADPYAGITLIPVSSDTFNRFQFSAPVKQLLFPAEVPASKPLYVAGNREVLVSFGPGMPDVAQMVAVLENGTVVTMYLKPRPGPGALVHAGNAAVADSAAPAATDVSGGSAPTEADAAKLSRGASDKNPALPAIALLKRVEQGDIPSDFEAVTPPAMVAMDKFTVAPIAAWTDHATYTVYAYQLIAAKDASATVAPAEFYRPGVLAVDVTGDQVDASASPYLYVVEEYVDAGH